MFKAAVIAICCVWLVSSANNLYYSSCIQSATRTCNFGTNITDRLLSLKKGGSDVLSTNNYDSAFFPCEEYNYNCGYLEDQNKVLTIADGVQLNTTYSELLNWVPSDSTLTNMIKPYLTLQGSKAQCVSTVFPLTLTDAQSNTVLTGYLSRLTSNISTLYNANKASFSLLWADLNINIKTAVLEMAKYNINNNFIGSSFWTYFLFNNFLMMSNELKANHTSYNCPECLHSAYLIDSVTTRCNKYQSINFLVDQSGSIGSGPFQFAKDFLTAYVTQTYDDLSIMSIHFFDSSYEPYIDYGNNRATILSMIAAKSYRSGGTNTGIAINASIAKINAANYPNGVPKILVILTDGGSNDLVLEASNYARSQGIILFCVGIGSGVNNAQLLQIAGTQSNIVNIQSYSSLGKLVSLIENYFCKQIMDININQTIYGNVVRVPTSPSFFRVQRSPIANQYYKLSIYYKADPQPCQEEVRESHFDPFPDRFSEYAKTQNYRTGILTKVYFISPASTEEIPVKKVYTITQTPDHAYVSVAGNTMNFNISLTPCGTSDCIEERTTAASIGKYSSGNTADGEGSTTGASASTNIFLPIGLALGALGLCTFGTIYGLRKFAEAPEEEANQLKPQNEEMGEGEGEMERNDQIAHQDEAGSRSGKGHSQRSHSKKSHKKGGK